MAAARRLPCDPLHCCTWILTAVMSAVLARDVVVARTTGVWERLYAPVAAAWKVLVVVYCHGGGFCVGSARTACVVMSVDYRLEPEFTSISLWFFSL
ncbi:hypothetical protein QYE76_031872 [Lolium multiflorum]|uniref:Alpha/beta hydrolase fold-3 domain-containing protein n=1 Tax=Lolium multiflorum TaxID=4521 RepID=A0AAD8QUD7_LOLMU|nr:hypothetical protein QYE76_031872 [Lolium multiflorum]